jgi:DNA-binding NarL/FixJ family response regulator
MSAGTVRVALADDQRLLREGLRIILDAAPDIAVVGVAEDGLDAIALAAKEQPDVMLLDIRMPRCDGIEATPRVLQASPQTRVLLLTTFDMPDLVVEGMRAGASGFLLKDSSAEQLCAAVRAAAEGQVLLQGQSAAGLLAGLARPSPAETAPPARQAPAQAFGLTEREGDVLRLIARGLSNAEIAQHLVVSEATVKTHINHIFAKLGARDRAHALVLAQQHKLVPYPPSNER